MAKLPDLDAGNDANRFRDEVRDWLFANGYPSAQAVDQSIPPNHRSVDREFSRKLSAKGWLGLTWPLDRGGQARTALEQLVFEEELAYSKAPISWHFVAVNMIGPTLISLGTDLQKATWLPGILGGGVSVCLGYSEPDFGSDLANIQFRAKRIGNEWSLNGQKTFNTGAGYANYCWLAARTGAPESKRRGISVFLVPMGLPGIQCMPMTAMGGHRAYTLFFDDVRVPLNAIVGAENEGWSVITKALTYERVALAAIASRARGHFDRLVLHLREKRPGNAILDSYLLDRIGMLAADIDAARLLALKTARVIAAGKDPSSDAAILKIHSSELMQRVAETGLEILAQYAPSAADSYSIKREFESALLDSFIYTIGGGTNDIQRNIVAAGRLGLRGL